MTQKRIKIEAKSRAIENYNYYAAPHPINEEKDTIKNNGSMGKSTIVFRKRTK